MRAVVAAWGRLRFCHWAGALALGLLLGVIQKMAGDMSLFWWHPDAVLSLLLHRGLAGVIFLMAVTGLEAIRPDPGYRGYFVASIAAGVACSLVYWPWISLNVALEFGMWIPTPTSWVLAAGFFSTWVPGTMVVFIYVHFRHSREAARRLFERQAGAARERQRQAASGHDDESRRLMPREVAAEMRRIARLYANNATAADGELDGLIQRLRQRSA